MPIVKAKEAPDFAVDRTIGALLNTNKTALQAYRHRRERSKRIDQLESEVQDLKILVKQLLENRNK